MYQTHVHLFNYIGSMYLYCVLQAAMAQEYGCRGLILYSDPEDYTPDNYQEVYPDSWFLPGTGVQRGNVKKSQGLGDPLTPGYPAISNLTLIYVFWSVF